MVCQYGLSYSRDYSRGWDAAKRDFDAGASVPRYNGANGDAYNEGYEDGWNDSKRKGR